MLSSSCAAALLAGTGGHAAAQDAPRLWGAWGELGAQAGAETNAFLEGFMPLGQDADSIVFLDMRLDYGQNSRGSTSAPRTRMAACRGAAPIVRVRMP